MTTKTEDRPQIIPSSEVTLLRLAEAPDAMVELTKEQADRAREIDEAAGCHTAAR